MLGRDCRAFADGFQLGCMPDPKPEDNCVDFQTIPVVRIFDEQKAREFYLGFLGMQVDWEHRYEAGFPLYLQVS